MPSRIGQHARLAYLADAALVTLRRLAVCLPSCCCCTSWRCCARHRPATWFSPDGPLSPIDLHDCVRAGRRWARAPVVPAQAPACDVRLAGRQSPLPTAVSHLLLSCASWLAFSTSHLATSAPFRACFSWQALVRFTLSWALRAPCAWLVGRRRLPPSRSFCSRTRTRSSSCRLVAHPLAYCPPILARSCA